MLGLFASGSATVATAGSPAKARASAGHSHLAVGYKVDSNCNEVARLLSRWGLANKRLSGGRFADRGDEILSEISSSVADTVAFTAAIAGTADLSTLFSLAFFQILLFNTLLADVVFLMVGCAAAAVTS